MLLPPNPEPFTGPYNGVAPITLLAKGALPDGKNVRRASAVGGWKARKGCTLLNTTQSNGGAAVKSLHYYKNPVQLDAHFIVQINQLLLKGASTSFQLLTEASADAQKAHPPPVKGV